MLLLICFFFPDILFIYNSEPPCLQLDANNNEWMILFAFLVLNLYVKIKICFGLPHEFLQVFHVLLSHVNSRCFFFFFSDSWAGLPACLMAFVPSSLSHSLPFFPPRIITSKKKLWSFPHCIIFPKLTTWTFSWKSLQLKYASRLFYSNHLIYVQS